MSSAPPRRTTISALACRCFDLCLCDLTSIPAWWVSYSSLSSVSERRANCAPVIRSWDFHEYFPNLVITTYGQRNSRIRASEPRLKASFKASGVVPSTLPPRRHAHAVEVTAKFDPYQPDSRRSATHGCSNAERNPKVPRVPRAFSRSGLRPAADPARVASFLCDNAQEGSVVDYRGGRPPDAWAGVPRVSLRGPPGGRAGGGARGRRECQFRRPCRARW